MKTGKGLLIIILTFYVFRLPLTAQDRPAEPARILPFQQQAEQPVNEDQLAMRLFQNREYEKALELFEQLYTKKPSAYYYTYYLHCLLELKEYNRAFRLVRDQRKSAPEALKFLVDLGYIYYREGDEGKSRKIYDEALEKLGPEKQQVYDLANAFITKGENAYAIQTYLKGRILLNNSYPFSFELANVYERMGNLEQSIEEYLHLLAVDPNYLKTVEDRLQNQLVNDPDNEKSELIRTTLLQEAQKYPDISQYSELLWWYSIQQKDFELALLQAKALDRRLKEPGDRIIQLAQLAVANDQIDVAINAYRYLMGKGDRSAYYDLARMELINCRFLKLVKTAQPALAEVQDLENELVNELTVSGENRLTVPLIKNLAHLYTFYLDQSEKAIDLLTRATELKDITPQTRADCKLALGDIYLFSGNVWEATLLYQQVYKEFKYDVIGQDAKLRNARLSFFIQEFKWAQAQADVLKAATSKLIANDAMALSLLVSENFDPDSNTVGLALYARAELMSYRNQNEQALKSLDSILILFTYHPILDDMLIKKSEILVNLGRMEEADSALSQLLDYFPEEVLADEALMKRAIIQEDYFRNRELAMTLYVTLMETFPASVYVIDARKRFRILREEKTNDTP